MLNWTLPIVNKLNAAYAAALALVTIQVSIGILYKASQTGGNYTFSASSSVTISEFLKLLLSTYFFYREWLQRKRDSIHHTLSIDDEPRTSGEEKPMFEDAREDINSQEVSPERSIDTRYWTLGSPKKDLQSFIHACRDELPSEVQYGFAQLALFYVLINNTAVLSHTDYCQRQVFLLYRLADPGTIQLIKSGTTLVTALISMFALNTEIVRGQWIAIVLQVCGIVTTQYRPGGAAYSLSTYLILVFQTTISAVSSVYNQNLCKSVDKSLHVMNMCLYGSGMCLNLVLHLTIRCIKWDEPGFFTGYGSWGSYMVILSNVFIGLAMTAVYKYADAIIKCFATAISTGILLYISPILFDVSLSFLVIPGTFVVFIATWLYMEASPPKSSNATSKVSTADNKRQSLVLDMLWEYSSTGRYRRAGLSFATALTLLMITMLNFTKPRSTPKANRPSQSPSAMQIVNSTKIQSPFQNTLAYVRWNSNHPERLPLIHSGYTPFFNVMHISMPLLHPAVDKSVHNLTYDTWEDPYTIYHSVRDTMSLILEDPAMEYIDGLFYFHFDAWVDPLQFAEMDRRKIWFPNSPDPKWECMKNIDRYGSWWGWGEGYHEQALQAAEIASHMKEGKYVVDPEEWCIGWTDIHFIPRRFFKDYITLSDIFFAVPVFHEIAVPTILHIIDKTYQPHPTRSVIEQIGDCWGHCCAENPLVEDILWRRCGHKLDFLNENVTKVHFERLASNALMLGRLIE